MLLNPLHILKLILKPQALSLKPLTLLFVALVLLSCNRNEKEESYVIMLSMDGFRWDYASKTETPNFDRLESEGVKAQSLIPAYPSKTFPNHYTIATGLYPDNHGIVQNNFFDTSLNKEFKISNRNAVEDRSFWGGEPIWETAERHGIRAASFFWVGTEGEDTYLPSIRKKYDEEVPFSTRTDSVISWLQLPEKDRPHLILFYFHEPDGVGHRYGPDSNETKKVISELDKELGYFLDELEQAEDQMGIEVNFLLVSDHGMLGIKQENNIILDEHINFDRLVRIHGGNPVYLLTPDENYIEEAYSILQNVENLKVWKKSELPEHYHYGSNPRIEELVLEPDSGWGIHLRSRSRGYSAGTHGYDPLNKDMHGIFYATGPAFKTGQQHETFQNIDIYSIIATILDLKPAQTDGSIDQVKTMLVPKK